MPFGTPADVAQTVRACFDTLGAGGGYVCAPSHDIEPDVPWENVLAFVDTCRACAY